MNDVPLAIGGIGVIVFVVASVASLFPKLRKSSGRWALVALCAIAFGFISNRKPQATQTTEKPADAAPVPKISDAAAAAAEAEKHEKSLAEQAAAEEKCRKDLSCIGDRKTLNAARACEPLIEARAKNDFRWVDGILELKFGTYKWVSQEKGVVAFLGDAIEFQNGLGNWVRHSYLCEMQIDTDIVQRVVVKPGRI